MKTKRLSLVILGGLSLPLLSQQGQGPPPPPDPVGMSLDKDRDGELSRSEIRRAVRSLLKLDENDDDALSSDELKPEPPQGRRPKGKDRNQAGQQPPPLPSALMTALDTDKSGDLSKEEIEAAAESLGELDRDEDGKLSGDEAGLKQRGMPGQQGGGANQGGGGPGGPRGGGPRGPRPGR